MTVRKVCTRSATFKTHVDWNTPASGLVLTLGAMDTSICRGLGWVFSPSAIRLDTKRVDQSLDAAERRSGRRVEMFVQTKISCFRIGAPRRPLTHEPINPPASLEPGGGSFNPQFAPRGLPLPSVFLLFLLLLSNKAAGDEAGLWCADEGRLPEPSFRSDGVVVFS